MKGYKAFEKGLICRGKQYKENTVFEEDSAEICEKGMHFCENPLDVLDYYPLLDDNGNFTEFADVESLDEAKTDDNKKFCTTKLKIGVKLSFGKYINACVDFILNKTKHDVANSTSQSSGDYSQLASSGDYSQLASSGDYSQLASSGYYSKLASSGYYSKLASSGYYSKLASSGDYSQLASSGDNSVLMCAGPNGMAKATKGSWITLSEWAYVEDNYIPICVKTERVDGEKIKEDIFYKLENGEFKEV